MNTSILKTKLIPIIIGILLIGSFAALAQKEPKSMGKMEQIKKIKILDILNLDEKASEAFLIKYNAMQKKVVEKKEAVEKEADELRVALETGISSEEILKRTERILQLNDELFQTNNEKLKSMKTVLDEKSYAKYIVFEALFMREFGKELFKTFKEGEGRGRKRD